MPAIAAQEVFQGEPDRVKALPPQGNFRLKRT